MPWAAAQRYVCDTLSTLQDALLPTHKTLQKITYNPRHRELQHLWYDDWRADKSTRRIISRATLEQRIAACTVCLKGSDLFHSANPIAPKQSAPTNQKDQVAGRSSLGLLERWEAMVELYRWIKLCWNAFLRHGIVDLIHKEFLVKRHSRLRRSIWVWKRELRLNDFPFRTSLALVLHRSM